MQLFSHSSSKYQIPLFSPNHNHSKFILNIPISIKTKTKTLHPCSLSSEEYTTPFQETLQENNNQKSSDGFLEVRRPFLESSDEEDELQEEEIDGSKSSSVVDKQLFEFARKMPIFEPKEVEMSSRERKPLGVNLELALYRAKVLARNYKFDAAMEILHKCISVWPEDGRAYVALAKALSKQWKNQEARNVYERGCQATQGENPYIWQCWAILESKMGNIRRARELFDAATVADKSHIAAWHGWAVLELKQGNIMKARNLLGRGLKYGGGNEYVYQTLALLEAKANRVEQARYLFKQASKCNPKSCASWLAWAQLEMQMENDIAARQLFERAVQASPKNRFAWHIWGVFEANLGNIDKGRMLLKIGHTLNPRDPVLLQSLALLEYRYSTANLARVIFRRASELDPRHQPVWIAWGWMEWKEGNIGTARQLYQRALSINSASESAARCLQAWGVLEQRLGNMSAARRLFRSSLNINSQSYITWMTWASLEEEQGNSVRAEEIREHYFQQRTEVVDDASWVTGLLDIFDPAFDTIKRLLKIDQTSYRKVEENLFNKTQANYSSSSNEEVTDTSLVDFPENNDKEGGNELIIPRVRSFNLDKFIKDRLCIDITKLEVQMELTKPKKIKSLRNVWRAKSRNPKVLLQP